VENGTVFHYSTHAVVLNYRMEAGSLQQEILRRVSRSSLSLSVNRLSLLAVACAIQAYAIGSSTPVSPSSSVAGYSPENAERPQTRTIFGG
jgi:hypothetical protein